MIMGPSEINRAMNLVAGIVEMISCLEEYHKAKEDPTAALSTAAILQAIETHHERGLA